MRVFSKVVKYPILSFNTQKIMHLQGVINGGLNMYILDGAEIKISHERKIFITVTMKEKEPETFGEKIRHFFTRQNLGFEIRLLLQKDGEPRRVFRKRVPDTDHSYRLIHFRARGKLADMIELSIPAPNAEHELQLAVLLFQRRLEAKHTTNRRSLIQTIESMTEKKY